jgi:hypothetical protein
MAQISISATVTRPIRNDTITTNSALLRAMMKFIATHNSDLGSLHSTAGLPIPNNLKEHTAFIFKGPGSCKNLAVAHFEVLLQHLTEGTTENHGQLENKHHN